MEKTLFIVSTPIGNYEDITLRAFSEFLKEVDFIVLRRIQGSQELLSKYQQLKSNWFELNEHNENEASDEILQKLLEGKCQH